MSASCVVIDGDCSPEVFREALVRARKEHKCCECDAAIHVGELHEYVTGRWDGDWSQYRTCARCLNIFHDYFDGRVFGMMAEEFHETHGFDYRDGIPADFPPCKNARAAPHTKETGENE